jgi:hypothetical protein
VIVSHDIFISYSRRDAERMVQVRDRLRGAGLQVWTDEGIEPGTESWKHSLSSAIKDCKWVVVLFSPESAASTWVSRELDFAELQKKKIFPLLVRGEVAEAIPFGFTTFQFIDIREDDMVDDGLQKLIDTLNGRFDGSRIVDSPQSKVVDSHVTAASVGLKTEDVAAVSQTLEQEILWKWIETPHMRLTLPSTAKVSEPSDVNIQRVLHLLFGNDDSLVVRVLQRWDKMGYLYSGMRGIKWSPLLLFSDITGLSPIIGIIGTLDAWFFTRFTYLFAPYVIQTDKIISSIKQQFDIDVLDFKWTRQSAEPVIVGTAHASEQREHTIPVAYKVYGKFILGTKKVYIAVMSCEESRFASAEGTLDQIVKSLNCP